MYEKPLLYDIAFSYREYPREVDLLLGWYRRASGRGAPERALELAAGPADHAIELARRGVSVTALDLSEAMCAYAREKARRAGVAIEVRRGNMIDFALDARFDLALTMISSLVHVYTIDEMVAHQRSVASHLPAGGVYIVEMPHPGDYLSGRPREATRWTCERDGISVEMTIGRPDDPYDPIRQVHSPTIAMTVRAPGGEVETHADRVPMKEWTATEFEAATRLAGVFEIAERHGDWRLDAPFDASEESWRMIQVLRKRG